MEVFDISMQISERMLVYPGNPRPSIRRYRSIPRNSTNESLISMGSHTGTHVDAGTHVSNNGYTADQIPLKSLVGRCKVVNLTRCGDDIHEDDLRGKLSGAKIILLKTNNSLKQYTTFRKGFAHVAMDAARYLVKNGVKTLGVDYLSVKRFGSDNDVHELVIGNMTLFEGLYLKNIKEGMYTFIGLPIKIAADGAPSRALLVRGKVP